MLTPDPTPRVRRADTTAGSGTPVSARSVAPLRRAVERARVVVLVLLIAAAVLDLVGRSADLSSLWVAGAYASTMGVSLGALVWCLGWFEPTRRGQLLWLFALLACALARFLRGSAGVPPDPPLLVLGAIGSCLLLLGWLRRGSGAQRIQS